MTKERRYMEDFQKEILRTDFESDTGKKYRTYLIFASFKYQNWLEENFIRLMKQEEAVQRAANIWRNQRNKLEVEPARLNEKNENVMLKILARKTDYLNSMPDLKSDSLGDHLARHSIQKYIDELDWVLELFEDEVKE